MSTSLLPKPDPTHAYYLEVVETDGRNLSTWEEDFITSIREQLDQGRRLSERQAEILERIYAEKT